MDRLDTGQFCLFSGFLCSVYGHQGHMLLIQLEFCYMICISDVL